MAEFRIMETATGKVLATIQTDGERFVSIAGDPAAVGVLKEMRDAGYSVRRALSTFSPQGTEIVESGISSER
jgi:hypothetical protein